MKLFLASSSPRRRELLERLGLKVEVIKPLWETKVYSDDFREMAELTALEKARSVMGWVDEGALIAADTIVVTDKGEVLGKPRNFEEAKTHLIKLSGRWHRVITGLALIKLPERIEVTDSSVTEVKFRELSESEIDCYLLTGEPMDKAGGYGIQGYASLFVEEIRGDFYNVMGLPISLLGNLLKRVGYDLLRMVIENC